MKTEKTIESKKDDGFSFAETLAVLAIMLVLSAGVGVASSRYIEKARQIQARSQIQLYTLALQDYYLDCGTYPSTTQGLSALWEKPVLYPVPKGWNGPYTDRVIQSDPWGNDYLYRSKKTNRMPFVIVSLGSDGREGGSGYAADIVSWQ